VEKRLRAEPPAERRQAQVRGGPYLFSNGLEEFRGRHQTARTHEPIKLHPQRDERDEVNDREQAQEKPGRESKGVSRSIHGDAEGGSAC
jgi:hypothetical protein